MSVSYDSHSDMKSNMIMVPETSVSASDGADAEKSNHKKNKKAPLSEGELRLNKIDENNIMYNDDNDKEQEHKQLLNEHIKLNEVEKYKKSIGDMDGIYSYFSWVHHVAILYLNIYLSSQQPQQIMMIQRTIFSLFWLLMIGTHFADFYTEFTYLFMYCASVYFTILAMLFFWLMMEYEVINEVKKKEEIQFKTIYDAIYYGRLDAIINQFDKKQHLMGMSSDGKSPLYYASELGQIDIAEWLMHKKVVDINIGVRATPIIDDWNQDGKKDLLVGNYDGNIRIYLNENSDSNPVYNTYSLLQVGGVAFDIGTRSAPRIYDWNGDGLKDMLVGEFTGSAYFLENTGTNAAPVFNSAEQFMLLNGQLLDANTNSNPVDNPRSRIFATDWNGDGAPDLLVGQFDGRVELYTSVVPEPVSSALFLTGIGVLGFRRMRQNKRVK